MGLSLFNRRICNTYPGVIKTCDNAALTVTPKPMTDGVGNDVPINIGTSTICYGGTQDFSGATVIGITGATAGLVPGAGTNSMVSDIGITATALQSCSIAIGNAAYNCCPRSINIGDGSTGLNSCTIGIGFATSNTGRNSIALGNNTASTATCSISIGSTALSGGDDAIGIGTSSNARCSCSISIGAASDILSIGATAVGAFTCVGPSANSSSVLGQFASSFSDCSTAIGRNACVGTCADKSMAIGCASFIADSTATLGNCNSIAIGTEARVCSCVSPSSNSRESIAIGNQAIVQGGLGIAIGSCTTANGNTVAIGYNVCETGGSNQNIIIGSQSRTECSFSVVLGVCSKSCDSSNTVIGFRTESRSQCITGSRSIIMGYETVSECRNTILLGGFACSNSEFGIGLGYNVDVLGDNSIAIGREADTCPATTYSIAIGYSARVCTGITHAVSLGMSAHANAACSVALGYNVISNRANVVTSCEYESCVAGCGLIVKTPDGLNSYRIAVDNSGNITTALA